MESKKNIIIKKNIINDPGPQLSRIQTVTIQCFSTDSITNSDTFKPQSIFHDNKKSRIEQLGAKQKLTKIGFVISPISPELMQEIKPLLAGKSDIILDDMQKEISCSVVFHKKNNHFNGPLDNLKILVKEGYISQKFMNNISSAYIELLTEQLENMENKKNFYLQTTPN